MVLMLGASSTAYADAISSTQVTFSNFQIVPTSGTVVFSTPQFGSPTSASGAAVNSLEEEEGELVQNPTHSEAGVSITFANAGGVSDLASFTLSANTNVTLSGCICSAETEGLAGIRQSFMIVGGAGNVDVTFSAVMQSIQNLVTDQFSLSAASEARFFVSILDVESFSFDSQLRIIGPNGLTNLEMQRQLSEVITLQFGQQYNLIVSVGAISRATQNEVPEPATVALLISGLGFMAGMVKKRRR
jgi:hypothetical protein